MITEDLLNKGYTRKTREKCDRKKKEMEEKNKMQEEDNLETEMRMKGRKEEMEKQD